MELALLSTLNRKFSAVLKRIQLKIFLSAE